VLLPGTGSFVFELTVMSSCACPTGRYPCRPTLAVPCAVTKGTVHTATLCETSVGSQLSKGDPLKSDPMNHPSDFSSMRSLTASAAVGPAFRTVSRNSEGMPACGVPAGSTVALRSAFPVVDRT
jgi:hypothetical protein